MLNVPLPISSSFVAAAVPNMMSQTASCCLPVRGAVVEDHGRDSD
jgi:hypothetical protein